MKAHTPPSSFLQRVLEILPHLHPAEKRLAQFMLDIPGELASYSALELAQLSSVSTATVSRFVRRLGYDSYEAARQHARTSHGQLTAVPAVQALAALHTDKVSRHAEQLHASVCQAYAGLSEALLEQLVQAVLQARKVWVLGMGNTQFLAQFFSSELFQIKENVVLLPGTDTMANYVSLMREQDLFLVLDDTRHSAEASLSVIEYVQQKRVPVLYLSQTTPALDLRFGWHIQCPSQADDRLNQVFAMMAVCHLLLSAVIEQAGQVGRERQALSQAVAERLRQAVIAW